MLDIQFIRDNQEAVREAIKNKNVNLDLDRLLLLDEERRKLLPEVEGLKSLKNDLNEQWAQAKTDEEREPIISEGKKIKDKLEALEPEYKKAKQEFEELLDKVPSIPSSDTPIGKDETENKVIRTWGDKPEFSFSPKEHFELGKALGVIDTEKAAKISGARFAYIQGDLAFLEFALIQHTLSILTNETLLAEIIQKAGLTIPSTPFIPVIPPVFIKPEVMQKMARLEPKDERYHIPSDDLYLVGSAEHTLGPIHMKETLDEETLPIRYLGFSTAFRREAGSYGKDMKGILRLHQFDKLEMESFTVGEQGTSEQDLFVALQEYLLQSLKLPYQVVAICTGDMGKPDVRQIDMETWLPGQGKYRETHTSDYMGDYQARRLDTKVKRKNGSTEFVHMNDATAFAIGRTLIAILENYQEEDGSVVVPEVLRAFVGKDVIKPKVS